MKRIMGLVLVAAVAGSVAVASQAGTAKSSSRSHGFHATKECTSTYHGMPGEFCTIQSSNLGAIPRGSKVFYFEATAGNGLDSDLALYAGPGNVALGHVVLSFGSPPTGVITFRGGTGDFKGFRARAVVTYEPPPVDLWHWDGTYRFRGRGH